MKLKPNYVLLKNVRYAAREFAEAEATYEVLLEEFERELIKRVKLFWNLRYVYICDIEFEDHKVTWAERFSYDDEHACYGAMTYDLITMRMEDLEELARVAKAVTGFIVKMKELHTKAKKEKAWEEKQRATYLRLKEIYGD